MKKNKLFFFIAFLAFINTIQAQKKDGVTGIITNYDTKPLEDVTVYKLNTSLHTHTNEQGYFELSTIKIGDTLKISHLGYKPQQIVCNTAVVTVLLESAQLELNEIAIKSVVSHLNIVSRIDLKLNPVSSSQELLRKVPGLFIGQHAGGGKAEQIFLRGFDIDHGTDIAVSVDGMPVNMVSHAHGQGYADLHFLIPETVDKVDFDKGPYAANKGNLATAGYVAFATKERIDSNLIAVEAGQFNTFRMLGLFNLLHQDQQSAYIAIDYNKTDSFFDSPQDFNRLNLMAKYTKFLSPTEKLSVSVSDFSSKWTASGQIPSRAVASGLISNFGAIDNTEGGETSRTNVNIAFQKQVDATSFLKTTAFYSQYAFELYSNFTFNLEDSINGDQIRQKEKRRLFGFNSEFNKEFTFDKGSLRWQTGIGLRKDATNDTELSHTLNRQTVLEQIKLGDIDELNLYAYTGVEFKIGQFFINPAVRFDEIRYAYYDKLAPTFDILTRNKVVVSPKLNFLYQENKNLQLFLKLGKGFHSNDARVVTSNETTDVLPAAYGADLGATWKPMPNLILNTALWYLYSEQEFVYVGDAGIVEPSGRTERRGIDVGARYQFLNYFFLNADFTFNNAKSLDAEQGQQYIPLAPITTFTSGLSFLHPSGFSSTIKTRLLGDRAANEDNSLIAKGYVVTDVNADYQFKKGFSLGFIIQNVFNTTWKETQFATESRLKNEVEPVTEINFTPGTPFNAKLRIGYRF